MRSDAGEEYDFEAIQDPPPALPSSATGADMEIFDSGDESDEESDEERP